MKISEKIRKMTDEELAKTLYELSQSMGEKGGIESAEEVNLWLNAESEEE